MARLRADLHQSFNGSPYLKGVRKALSEISPEDLATRLSLIKGAERNTWEHNPDSLIWEYKGEQSIQTLEQAISFCEADLTKYKVDRFLFNSWDVTGKDFGKRTNYQAKVWFSPIENLVIPKPKLESLNFASSSKDVGLWVIVGCVHRPFHDKKLWSALLSFIHDNKSRIEGIILNGDYLDLRSLSSHSDYIPPGIDLGKEYSDGKKGILEIKQALGKRYNKVKKVYHYGNHEERFTRDKSTLSKYGDSLLSPEEALGLIEDNWQIQTDWKEGYTKIGNNLSVFHGIYFGKNAAKSHLDAIPNESCIFNHTHRLQSYTHGENTAYNTGWFGDINSEGFKYASRQNKNSWRQGFATVYLDKEGNHTVIPISVTKSSFIFEGKKY